MVKSEGLLQRGEGPQGPALVQGVQNAPQFGPQRLPLGRPLCEPCLDRLPLLGGLGPADGRRQCLQDIAR
ncbi:hypothetical protein SHKM778_33380 [Streptomyces sp. KM77-8]|uniref:Uncharacterized protein n=1 Tax=Streptomyces haneummycinicus TaxID=3074435 RepID=A0AAT9HI03_9ACTN